MSGHSKWSTIKHKKAALDSKRGKAFTKIIKEITVAAKSAGGDPATNPRLRLAIANAKAANMPSDNVDRAIKKGTGELEGVNYEDVTYEGYGAGGAAILVHCLTDNKNRTAAEIRSIFTKKNGNLGGPGSVAWQFEQKGLIVVAGGAATEDQLMELALGAGAEDLNKDEDTGNFEITCQPQDFEAVKKALEVAKIKTESAEVTMLPKNLVKTDVASTKAVLQLLEAMEDHDDVQNVYSNVDIPKELME
ncbi:MAG: YebC/PmpR family DNA-binding transcriptional regulator [Candidatus Omnitrophica bacterium]|nr:YebC/PmpR family DNA-binding transcriptional regulator [Candidatus Omnitrophota bacterium]